MKPSIGRIVHYCLSSRDADAINRRRDDAMQTLAALVPEQGVRVAGDGKQIHVGNIAREGDVYPAIIVRAWNDDLLNLQVFLDGNDTYWATSAHLGAEAGTWSWPTRV